MRIATRNKGFKNPVKYLVYLLIAFALGFAQTTVFSLIEIGGITPDLLIVLIAYIAIREGQFRGIIAGFAIGLMFDFISLDAMGTNALSKLLVAYATGFFHKEDKSELVLNNFRFVLVTFGAAFIHNLVYYFFYIKAATFSFWPFFLKYGLAASFYTSVFSVIVVLVSNPRR